MMLARRCCATSRPSRGQAPAIACSRPQRAFRVYASANGVAPELAEGTTVKVVKPIKVWHVPKFPDGVDLEGMQGVVVKDVAQYKGKTLSANLPYRVAFETEKDGAPIKFQAHLVSVWWLGKGGGAGCSDGTATPTAT
jgi:hypothetical protein